MKADPLLLQDDAFAIPPGSDMYSGRTLICLKTDTINSINRYQFFDEGEIFWMQEHVFLRYLNAGAAIIRGD